MFDVCSFSSHSLPLAIALFLLRFVRFIREYNEQAKGTSDNEHLSSSNEKKLFNSMDTTKKNSPNERLFFYHGTTEVSAQYIIARGIHLRTRDSRCGDFGYGFYTTHNFTAALHHAENRSIKTHGKHRPAGLVFVISKAEFNGHEILCLI
jgi:hypothetical protein